MTSGFLQQQVSRLCQRECIGDLLEMTARLILSDADRFEEQGLSFHVYFESRDLPVICTQPLLADIERAALIQVAQNSSTEFDIVTSNRTPGFHPSTREARVFHEMEGKLRLNRKEDRLAEMDGRLMRKLWFFQSMHSLT